MSDIDDEHRAAAEPAELAFDDGEVRSMALAHRRCISARRWRRLLQRVAQLAAGVVNEHVVERRALHRERLDGHAGSRGGLEERMRRRRAVAGRDAVDGRPA